MTAWRVVGAEIFYATPSGAMMRVGVENGPTWSATTPTKLFEGPYVIGASSSATGRAFDLSRDDQRFLVIARGASEPATAANIIVVQHWDEELRRLVPVGR